PYGVSVRRQLPVWGLCVKELSLLARAWGIPPRQGVPVLLARTSVMLLAPRVNLRPHQGWQTAKVNVAARALSASITRAGIWREVLEFVRLPLPLLRVGRGRFFDHNIWPDFRVFRVQRQPYLKPRLRVR